MGFMVHSVKMHVLQTVIQQSVTKIPATVTLDALLVSMPIHVMHPVLLIV